MDDSNRLSTRTAVLLALSIVLGALGDLLLSSGMKQIGSVEAGPAAAMWGVSIRVITNAEIWLGIVTLLLLFACSLVLFSRIDYSYAQPASAIGYGLVALLGYIVLGEAVTAARWAGIGCICVGVVLVGRTCPRTTV